MNRKIKKIGFKDVLQMDRAWSKYENTIYARNIQPYNFHQVGFDITKIVINANDRLYAIVNAPDETTIFYDSTIEVSPTMKEYISEYAAYLLTDTCDLVDIAGLVKQASSTFADQGIPIMYITSMNDDIVLVQKEYEEKADKLIGLK